MLHVRLKNEQFNKSADRNPVYLEYISFRSTKYNRAYFMLWVMPLYEGTRDIIIVIA